MRDIIDSNAVPGWREFVLRRALRPWFGPEDKGLAWVEAFLSTLVYAIVCDMQPDNDEWRIVGEIVLIMKLPVYKLCIVLLMLAVVIPMILPGPNGKPLMAPSDWLPDSASLNDAFGKARRWLGGLTGGAIKNSGLEAVGVIKGETMYKWQDDKGRWHFSDTAPEGLAENTAERLPKLENTLQPVAVDNGAVRGATGGHSSIPTIPLPTTIPVDKIPQLIDDAKNVQKLANERQAKLDGMQ